jgi:SNF2 family DNA or RNA helicase
MRLVLTGTPIQNNLEELYTLVSFAAPGYLGSQLNNLFITKLSSNSILNIVTSFTVGSIGEFNANFAVPIQRGCEPDASSYDREHGATASARLREVMSLVLLRRTQREVLTHLLPPRTDFVIYCRMTASQSERYNSIADQIRW